MSQDMVCEPETLPSPIPKRRKLTLWDVKHIADKVVKFKLNETQACYSLNINPKQWFDYKNRHKNQAQFDAIIETIRASQIENCVQTIKNHGDGIEYTALNKQGEVVTLTKPGDWRASAWIAERVLAADVFGDKQQPQVIGNDGLRQLAQMGIDAGRLLLEGATRAKSRAVVEVQSKALTDGSNDKA